MEGLLWKIVMQFLNAFEKYPQLGRYADRDILQVALWAILHDRPLCWACQAAHWTTAQAPRLPHPSTLSRRLRQPGLIARLEVLHQTVLRRFQLGLQAAIDGKPLIVSDQSKDPDAHNGRGTRGMSRGYKLHAVVSEGSVIAAFEVQPLNVNERRPAKRLLRHLPEGVRRVVADGNYDGASLHVSLAGSGVRLYTPIQNHYVSPRSHRRRHLLLRLMDHPVGQQLLAWREQIERAFGLLGNVGFGFKGLPNWSRRLHRVRLWISGKVLIHNLYQLSKRSS